MIKKIILLFLILLLTRASASAENSPAKWYLPSLIDDQNTKINFILDSTWHTVHGSVSGVSGLVELKDPNNPLSVLVSLELPVEKMDTDNSSRDKKMMRVMSQEVYSTVTFKAEGLKSCTPSLVLKNKVCDDSMHGNLKIRDVEKKVELPIKITAENNSFKISGSLSISWAEFGVEDPSILIASVDEIVTIEFEVNISGS
ncbi:MAG: YceI family protein [Bdellovibrionota bacterium]